jgi:hypothetical protein
VLWLATSNPVGAADAPDSAQLQRVQKRLEDLSRVRVVAGSRQFLGDDPVASAEGLRFGRLTMREGFAYQTVADPPLVSWSEIRSIQGQGHNTRNGAVLGGLAGAAIGLMIGAHQPCQSGSFLAGTSGNCGSRKFIPVLLGVVGGAGLGAVIGSRFERWQPIYPEVTPR